MISIIREPMPVPPGVDSWDMLEQIARHNKGQGPFRLRGAFQFDLYRKGRHIDRFYSPNIVTQEGLAYALGVALISTTQLTSWYILLKDNTNDPVDGTETYAAKSFTEITSYDEANRPTWTGGSISGTTTKSVSNSGSPADFTISTTVTVYGAAMVSNNTKGDSTGGGTMLNASNFASSKPLVDNDTLQVTYTNTTQDDGV